MLHNVIIVPTSNQIGQWKVYVDDHELDGVTSIQTSHSVGELPYVNLVLEPIRANIETLAETDLRMDITTVQTAISCIQFTIRLDEDFRNGILTGIADVLQNEQDNLPEKIMNRVFGLD